MEFSLVFAIASTPTAIVRKCAKVSSCALALHTSSYFLQDGIVSGNDALIVADGINAVANTNVIAGGFDNLVTAGDDRSVVNNGLLGGDENTVAALTGAASQNAVVGGSDNTVEVGRQHAAAYCWLVRRLTLCVRAGRERRGRRCRRRAADAGRRAVCAHAVDDASVGLIII